MQSLCKYVYALFAQISIAKKNSLKECVFVNSELKIQCYVVKNTLLQTADFAHWAYT